MESILLTGELSASRLTRKSSKPMKVPGTRMRCHSPMLSTLAQVDVVAFMTRIRVFAHAMSTRYCVSVACPSPRPKH